MDDHPHSPLLPGSMAALPVNASRRGGRMPDYPLLLRVWKDLNSPAFITQTVDGAVRQGRVTAMGLTLHRESHDY